MIIPYLAVSIFSIWYAVYITRKGERKRHWERRHKMRSMMKYMHDHHVEVNNRCSKQWDMIVELKLENVELKKQVKKYELPQLGGKYDIKPITSR
jgi:hypothetical protein